MVNLRLSLTLINSKRLNHLFKSVLTVNGSDVEEHTVPVDGVELLMVVKQHEEAETGGSPDAH